MVVWLVFIVFQVQGIYTGDSGDLVTAAVTFGVPHPPGYPLYSLLGWLVHLLPFGTPAWQVTLLSSFFHALTVTGVFFLVYKLTRQYYAALFSSILLAGNYLFFLYSVTPEVFALFDAFIVALCILVYLWQQTKQSVYLLILFGVFGLSLSHHHVVLFLVPALIFMMWSTKKQIAALVRHKSFLLLAFCCLLLGLLPYIYIPFAANGSSMINWDRAVNLQNFIRLVTRQDYGTFVSGGVFGALLSQRMLQIKMYVQLFFVDFHWIGACLVLLGVWYIYSKNKLFTLFLLLTLVFVGPAFLFYASFPLASRFTIGTFERFLLSSYVILAIFMGSGVAFLVGRLQTISRVLAVGLMLVLLVFPITKGGMTLWRFWGLSADMTANNLGYDLLGSLPKESMVLLGRDTTLFTVQYIRYALGFRPDVAVLHASRIGSSDYAIVTNKNFPDILFPPFGAERYLSTFVTTNVARRRIFSNSGFAVDGDWFWVPYGLVFELVQKKELPQIDDMITANAALWDTFHDPNIGVLGRYPHLMLSDIRDVYAGAAFEYAKTLVRANKLSEAKLLLERAVAYQGDVEIADMYTYLGLTDLMLGNCDDALDAFSKARSLSFIADKLITYYEAETYRDCKNEALRADELFSAFEKLRKQEETPLE